MYRLRLFSAMDLSCSGRQLKAGLRLDSGQSIEFFPHDFAGGLNFPMGTFYFPLDGPGPVADFQFTDIAMEKISD